MLASWEPASNETVFNISQCQGKTNRSCAIIKSDRDENISPGAIFISMVGAGLGIIGEREKMSVIEILIISLSRVRSNSQAPDHSHAFPAVILTRLSFSSSHIVCV
jgi:hypothetical protein